MDGQTTLFGNKIHCQRPAFLNFYFHEKQAPTFPASSRNSRNFVRGRNARNIINWQFILQLQQATLHAPSHGRTGRGWKRDITHFERFREFQSI